MKKVIVGINDLATANPELTKEWHPTKNGELTPAQVTRCSNKKVWWLGKCGHEWKATVANRNHGCGCMKCSSRFAITNNNDLATANPELAKEWHPTKNGDLTPKMVARKSGKRAWWLCSTCGHEWQTIIANRSNGSNCPQCSNKGKSQKETAAAVKRAGSLLASHPEAAKYWHPTKNGDLKPSQVTAGSEKKVWWLGECGHEWETSIVRQKQRGECPVCLGRKLLPGYNDLATTQPKLAKEWHPTKNGQFKPEMFAPKSSKKVWWLCSACGHEWPAVISNRTRGRGCPACAGKKINKEPFEQTEPPKNAHPKTSPVASQNCH